MADCLAHSRCSKLAINFLLRTIYCLCFCSPNSTGSLDMSTSLAYWSWTIRLLDLPTRSLINLYFLCSEPKGRSQPVHAFQCKSDPRKHYRGKCIILELDKPRVIPQPHHLLSVWPWLSYLNSLSFILIIGKREKFCQTYERAVMIKWNQVCKIFSPVPNICGHSRYVVHPTTIITIPPTYYHPHPCLSCHSHLARTSTILPGDCSVEPPSISLMNHPVVEDIYIHRIWGT